jgi:hypothetical protein
MKAGGSRHETSHKLHGRCALRIVGFVRSRDLGVEFVRRSRSAGTRAAEGLADQGDL